MYGFLLLFVSIYAFGISSCILSEIKPTVWPCCCKLQFELQERPNAKVLCNVTKPQPMKTDLMLRQYIVEFWTNCGKWEIKTIQDIRHRNDPVTLLFLWFSMTSKETKSYVEENEHFSHCAWWHGAVSTEKRNSRFYYNVTIILLLQYSIAITVFSDFCVITQVWVPLSRDHLWWHL